MIKLFNSLKKWKKALVIALILAFFSAVLSTIAPNRLSDLTNVISDGIKPNTDEINPKNSVKTKDFLNHFISYRFLFLIYNGELLTLKRILKAIVILSLALSLFSFILLLYTFEYLSEQKYSFIPITDLFLLTALIITIILFLLKLNALNKVIDGEFELDKKMVKLVIFSKMKNNKELLYDEKNMNNKEEKLE